MSKIITIYLTSCVTMVIILRGNIMSQIKCGTKVINLPKKLTFAQCGVVNPITIATIECEKPVLEIQQSTP